MILYVSWGFRLGLLSRFGLGLVLGLRLGWC